MVIKIVILCTLINAVVQANLIKENIAKDFHEKANDCLKHTNGSDDDIQAILNKDRNLSYKAKCLQACIMEKYDLIIDSQLNQDKVKKFWIMLTESDEKTPIIINEELLNCGQISETDRCEAAYQISKCMDNIKQKLGINIF